MNPYENVYLLQVYFHANQAHFRVIGFGRGLILKQAQDKLGNDLFSRSRLASRLSNKSSKGSSRTQEL